MNDNYEILKIDARGHVRISKRKQIEMLQAFDKSSMTATAFTKLHGIPNSTFATWLQKRKKQSKQACKDQSSQSLKPALSLIEVELTKTEPKSQDKNPALNLVLAHGVKAQLNQEGQIPLLKSLIKSLSC